MYQVTGIIVILILVIMLYVQLINEQRRAYDSATRTFLQIEHLLEENQKELKEVRKEYRETCLHHAETIARIIESNYTVLEDIEELQEIAQIVEVDEIHIFDKTGRIFTGTHPKYYNYTFDSGEQIGFFKPMLEDKTLKLIQDITPNKKYDCGKTGR